jgi:hypothetical protein
MCIVRTVFLSNGNLNRRCLMNGSNERLEEIQEAVAALIEEAKTLNSYGSQRGVLIQEIYAGLCEEAQALVRASQYPDCAVTYEGL